jgi:micrococcal nuclease
MPVSRAMARAGWIAVAASAAAAVFASCGRDRCGPDSGEVAHIFDGDTVALRSGEVVRYLLIDTPETGEPPECYGAEAREANRALVDGRTIRLEYDAQCEDRYGRLLAYVVLDGREVNRILVERGFACVLYIPPNGGATWMHFQQLQDEARQSGRGLWGACAGAAPC